MGGGRRGGGEGKEEGEGRGGGEGGGGEGGERRRGGEERGKEEGVKEERGGRRRVKEERGEEERGGGGGGEGRGGEGGEELHVCILIQIDSKDNLSVSEHSVACTRPSPKCFLVGHGGTIWGCSSSFPWPVPSSLLSTLSPSFSWLA